MTYKTTKTVMFGTLIAMMILPFSMVESAKAQEPTSLTIYDFLDKLVIEYNSIELERRLLQEEKSHAPDTEYANIIEEKIQEKMSSMREIITIVEILSPIEEEYRIAEKPYPTVKQLLDEWTLENKQDEIDSITVWTTQISTVEEEHKSRQKRGVPTQGSSLQTSIVHTQCNDWSKKITSIANASFDVNADRISWNWVVVDEKSVGFATVFGCTDVFFEELTIQVRNHAVKKNCSIITGDTLSGSETQNCQCGINNGNLVSWLIETTYEPKSGKDNRGNDYWHGLHRVT